MAKYVDVVEMSGFTRRLVGAVVMLAGVLALYRYLRSSVRNGFTYIVGKSWDGVALEHRKAEVTLRRGVGAVVEMHVRAPFYNDPPAPQGKPGEPFPQLWDYEVVEAFFLAESGKYLEVELCPHGQHIVLLLNGRRNAIRDQLPLQFTSELSGDEWTGTAYIPLEYFPPNVAKFNAYAIHGSGDDRKYETYKAVPGAQPDFHRLEYFEAIDFSKLAPENSQSSYTSTYWTK